MGGLSEGGQVRVGVSGHTRGDQLRCGVGAAPGAIQRTGHGQHQQSQHEQKDACARQPGHLDVAASSRPAEERLHPSRRRGCGGHTGRLTALNARAGSADLSSPV